MEEQIEIIFAILVGSVILWGVIHRYKTINTPEYFRSLKITVFVFAALGIGMSIINPERIIFPVNRDDFFLLLVITLSIYPLLISSLLGEKLYVFDFVKSILFYPIIFLFTVFIFLPFVLDIVDFNIVLTITVLPIIGFIHTVLGSILASVNIAIILTGIFDQGIGAFDISLVFDFLDMLGIESEPVKWIILICSTALGLSDLISEDKINIFAN